MSAIARTSQTLNRSQETSRQSSGNISSRGTPVSSTEGDDDDYDEDEDEDDDEDEEVEEEEEGEEAGNARFDEKFLAQLLSFDPSLGLQPPLGTDSLKSSANAFPSAAATQSSGGNNVVKSVPAWPFDPAQSASSSTSNQRALEESINNSFAPITAATPSNEFYDGAINFLTEILGSSSSDILNGGAGVSSPGAIDLSWLDQVKTPLGGNPISAPSPQASNTQFRQLQPLISNLIARLKGHPVDGEIHTGKSLEDDLVVLLQNLMAHRQAQQDRQAQQQMDQSMAVLQQGMPVENRPIGMSINKSVTASAPVHSTLANQPGFSIVDFDFGDDDDDPDFIPNTLGFANSKELNDVLAKASEGTMLTHDNLTSRVGQEVTEATWQQMMDSFQQAGSSNLNEMSNNAENNQQSESRRTRSTSRNVDMSRNSFGTRAFDTLSPQSSMNRPEGSEKSNSVYREDEDEERVAKKKGRKALSREEALERRRISNRECARRGRAKKKQEEEEIRVEFQKMRNLRSASRDMTGKVASIRVNEEESDENLPAGLRKKKKGRPAGSRAGGVVDKTVENESEMILDQDRIADLKADNRMLRAEMQRLIEENTQLRVRMIQVEERGQKRDQSGQVTIRRDDKRDYGTSRGYDLRTRFMDERQNSNHFSGGEEEDEEFNEEDEDESFIRNSLASRTLAFDPFKQFNPPNAVSRHKVQISRARDSGKRGIEERRGGGANTSNRSIEELIQGIAANQQGRIRSDNPTATMQEILQRAAEAGLV